MATAAEVETADGRTPLLGRRSTRRTLVAALALICLLFLISPFVADLVVTWLPPITILLIALLVVLNEFLRFATRGIAGAPERYVDERQEAVRNTAYRLSHRVLAIAFGIPLWLVVSYVTSARSGTPAVGAANLGLVATYLELLYFTPTAIIAWLEPDAVVDGEEDRSFRPPLRMLLPLSLVVLFLATPLIASTSLAMPARGSAWSQSRPGLSTTSSCRYVQASEHVGTVMMSNLQMNGLVCWNGKRVWRDWGLGTSYCQPWGYSFTSNVMRCTAGFLPDHSLDVKYQDTVRSPFLPALGRQMTLHLVVGPDGRVRTLTHSVRAASTSVRTVSRHVWRGVGNSAGTLHFSMPTGGLPLFTSHPWHLSFRFACQGLHHPRGFPPHLVKNTTFSLDINGGSWGSSSGTSYNADRGRHVLRMSNGGDYSMSIQALDACRWVVEAT